MNLRFLLFFVFIIPVSAQTFEFLSPLEEVATQTGTVQIGNGLATLQLQDHFQYINPTDAQLVLETWGNPSSETLGILIPSQVAVKKAQWGIIINYALDGFIDTGDAEDLNFEDILYEMKKDQESLNARRASAGHDTVSLVGWAEPPHYDAVGKKIYWAKELQFSGKKQSTLNYTVRMLGRNGVLMFTAVAPMSEFPRVKQSMNQLMDLAAFNPGFRYEDYNHQTDRSATYGMAGLISGKAGLNAVYLIPFLRFVAEYKWVIFGALCSILLLQMSFKRLTRSPEISSEPSI